MDAREQIELCKEFLEKHYLAQILHAISTGQHHIELDFDKLSKFSPELGTLILEQPDDVLGSFRFALEEFDLSNEPKIDTKRFHFRIANIVLQERRMIRNLRSKHLKKLLMIEGTVRQKSDVRPKTKSADFECPSCGHSMSIQQKEDKLRQPHQCPKCKYKGRFRLLHKELIDSQGIVLEEISSDLEGGEQPKRLKIYLEDDLVSPITDKKTNPGTNIRIVGVLREVEKIGRDGTKLTSSDFLFEANHVSSLSEDYLDIQITKEEEEKIKALASQPDSVKKLVKASAPGIYGHDLVKEAILMQFVGGVQKKRSDGVKNRGDIHTLLIGDPGSGKCVAPDTLVTLSDGTITQIQHLDTQSNQEYVQINTQLPSLQLNGSSGISTATKFWKRHTTDPLLKITLRSGKELKVTPNHPLFMSVNGHVVAKQADEFTVGEYIATPRSINVNGTYQQLEYTHKKLSNNTKKQKYPNLLNHRIARLLGYLCGDGCLRQTKTTGFVGFTTQSTELFGDFLSILKTEFELQPSIRQNKGSFEIYCSGLNTYLFFKTLFPQITQKSINKSIPTKITQSPNSVVAQFIKGLFDCDAHVNSKKRQIEYCTMSEQLAKEIQIILHRFGIISLLKKKTKVAINTILKRKVTAYELIIPRFSCDLYYEKIGFTVDYKKNALTHILTLPQNTNIDVIPNIGHLFTPGFVPRQTRAHYIHNRRLPSRTSAQKAKIPIADANVFWDKITHIETIPYAGFVYDFEVEHTHNFIANGVVVHNSQLLKRASVFAPKARYVSGKGASGAGLTAAVVKDDFMGGWALEAGALVLANRGVVCIDELDKMTPEDRSAMHEALEQQSVTVSKANIQATLMCETTVLAAANPKMGRFDPFENIAKQINLPPALINRFDLIFPFRDIPNEEGDERLATFVLGMHQSRDTEEPEIDTDTLRKFIIYARKNCFPRMSDDAREEIKNYYVKMRNSNTGDGGMTSISLSARQLEALIRMTEACAKLKLQDVATVEDAKRAIALLDFCLSQIGVDPETGKVDIDKIQTGFTTSERKKTINVREIIKDLEETEGKMIPVEKILDVAAQKGMNEDKVLEAIEKLKLSGDIYEPKRGFISRIV